MAKGNIWDRIVTEEEWIEAVRRHALGKNPSVALKALEWIGEGKGYIANLAGASPDEIEIKVLKDVSIQKMDN